MKIKAVVAARCYPGTDNWKINKVERGHIDKSVSLADDLGAPFLYFFHFSNNNVRVLEIGNSKHLIDLNFGVDPSWGRNDARDTNDRQPAYRIPYSEMKLIGIDVLELPWPGLKPNRGNEESQKNLDNEKTLLSWAANGHGSHYHKEESWDHDGYFVE